MLSAFWVKVWQYVVEPVKLSLLFQPVGLQEELIKNKLSYMSSAVLLQWGLPVGVVKS